MPVEGRPLKRVLDTRPGSSVSVQPSQGNGVEGSKGKKWTGTASSGASRTGPGAPLPSPAADATSTALRKGSYKEIMARAQAAKSGPAALGKISHKTQQFVPKREREKQEAEARAKAKASSSIRSNSTVKRVDRKGAIRKPEPAAKIKKERAPLAYQGTARPAGQRPSISSRSSGGQVPTRKQRGKGRNGFSDSDETENGVDGSKSYRYAGSSEEEAEDGSMDDGSDDMGGGGFAELEEEEERALRAARKEDAEALREENSHKQAKLERKKKLAALAAKAGKR